MVAVTQLLEEIEQGDPQAADRLMPLVYEELRRLAATHLAEERPNHSLLATALVHEAYLRLVSNENDGQWKGRGHFFGAAAEAMRRILIENARKKRRLKRNEGRKPINLESIDVALDTPGDEILALNDALDEFSRQFPDAAELVKLRYFAGFSQGEAAATLEIPRRTADRKWSFARAWLHRQLSESSDGHG